MMGVVPSVFETETDSGKHESRCGFFPHNPNEVSFSCFQPYWIWVISVCTPMD